MYVRYLQIYGLLFRAYAAVIKYEIILHLCFLVAGGLPSSDLSVTVFPGRYFMLHFIRVATWVPPGSVGAPAPHLCSLVPAWPIRGRQAESGGWLVAH